MMAVFGVLRERQLSRGLAARDDVGHGVRRVVRCGSLIGPFSTYTASRCVARGCPARSAVRTRKPDEGTCWSFVLSTVD
jgi:hypothetical protein